jgi:antitoxin component of RelBE/YafQ-DinJ toxin-antitoxin module
MVMAMTTVSFNIDEETYNAGDKTMSAWGVTPQSAFEHLYAQIDKEDEMPWGLPDYSNGAFTKLIRRVYTPVILPVNEQGYSYIDKEQYPDLYDWAVNG